jgi:hypothetical protein
MPFDVKKRVRPVRTRTYLNKDFDGFRNDLLRYAKTYFPDRINDFSEASLGGLLLELAAYVGDVNAFYLDHQFNELNVETAIESRNIESHVRTAGVDITGASPATVSVKFFIEVPAELSSGVYRPQESALPQILRGTVLKANNGTSFELVEDLDFAAKSSSGQLIATVQVIATNSDGSPLSYILTMTGDTVSGTSTTETFRVPDRFVPFRKITLSQENVTEILSVRDTESNSYYEVSALTQDVVYRGILNRNEDDELVKENLELLPAPYRFTKNLSLQTGLTTLQFGAGQGSTIDDDIIPDPSELAVPLFGKKTFSRFSIDPGSLLQTQTLGISPVNTTITVEYRHGGGLSHNVVAESIRTISRLLIKFPGSPSSALATQIRASLDVKNENPASGGENAPTLDELRSKVVASRNAQSRIVTREDLLARVYTMPSNFGRIYRAGVRSNPNNPLSTQLFIISRDRNKNLIISPDSLKQNLRTYLNQFRLISDAIDILDTSIINIGLTFQVATDPSANKNTVVQGIIADLQSYFDIKNFQIDQPIAVSDVTNIIINSAGVVSLISLKFDNKRNNVLEREYSGISFDVDANTFKGLIIGPPGSIFEVKYPEFDIVGSAI